MCAQIYIDFLEVVNTISDKLSNMVLYLCKEDKEDFDLDLINLEFINLENEV